MNKKIGIIGKIGRLKYELVRSDEAKRKLLYSDIVRALEENRDVWVCAFTINETGRCGEFCRPTRAVIEQHGYNLKIRMYKENSKELMSKKTAVGYRWRNIFSNREDCVEYYKTLLNYNKEVYSLLSDRVVKEYEYIK